jgi:hypothetical protein
MLFPLTSYNQVKKPHNPQYILFGYKMLERLLWNDVYKVDITVGYFCYYLKLIKRFDECDTLVFENVLKKDIGNNEPSLLSLDALSSIIYYDNDTTMSEN